MTKREMENYLRLYPRQSERWLNTCVACGHRGYRPDMPKETTTRLGREEIETAFAAQLRAMFEPLDLNEDGLCPLCAARPSPGDPVTS